MSDIEVRVNFEGVGQLLRGPEMEQLMRSYAESIQNRAGNGYMSDARKLGTRWISTVYTATREAMLDTAENNTLLKAIG